VFILAGSPASVNPGPLSGPVPSLSGKESDGKSHHQRIPKVKSPLYELTRECRATNLTKVCVPSTGYAYDVRILDSDLSASAECESHSYE
jgi:hypothetical protein